MKSGIAESVLEVVGGTPLVRYRSAVKRIDASILLKLEFMNPWGSLKDRTALTIIEDAESAGRLSPGGHIVEATSGNTGISLAAICAVKGYRFTAFLPEFVSDERKILLRMLGSEIILTSAEFGLAGPVAKCMEFAERNPGVFVADQTRNPSNSAAHEQTGAEIWEQTAGKVDIVVAASGTGGHLTGIARFLKKKNPRLKMIAVEPIQAAVLSGQVSQEDANPNHGIIGIGPGFIPQTLERDLIDEVAVIDVEQAYQSAREALLTNGLMLGTSSGAVLHAAEQIASRVENEGKTIVAIAASASERYLSTRLADEARTHIRSLQPVSVPVDYMDRIKNSAKI